MQEEDTILEETDLKFFAFLKWFMTNNKQKTKEGSLKS
jgi:hypothetical protein